MVSPLQLLVRKYYDDLDIRQNGHPSSADINLPQRHKDTKVKLISSFLCAWAAKPKPPFGTVVRKHYCRLSFLRFFENSLPTRTPIFGRMTRCINSTSRTAS